MTIGEQIKRERVARGMSQAQLAAEVGISQPAIKKIESGQTERSRYLPQICGVLGLAISDLDGMDLRPMAENVLMPGLELAGAKDLPVYASAEGGEGQMIVHVDPVDWVKRPTPLANVRGSYGLIVTGDSMEPEFWSGDIALVHPHLPPTPGSTYIFYAEDKSGEARAKIKHLLRVTATDWNLRQWNPPPGEKREFRLSRREWPKCHRVIGKYSRR
jgi:phage repressor protein C with HTH and peptisase S24 domain